MNSVILTANGATGAGDDAMSEKVIMQDSPEAAQYRTNISGWIASDGRFYGDNEDIARYAGCTHRMCSNIGCDQITVKHYTKCPACRVLADMERYKAMPRAEWDGIAMLYSRTRDKYYNNLDEAYDAIDDGQCVADLQLVICEPVHVRPLESDYCCDELTDDDDVPSEVADAMDTFNEAVKGIVLSWTPGKYALVMMP